MNDTKDLSTGTQLLAGAVRTVSDWPKPGVQFKDITPILADPVLFHEAVEALAAPFRKDGITKVVAIEARGFILGAALAERLGAGFVPVRKKGKLPYKTVEASYSLEYGTDTIEMHVDAIHPNDRVLIHDDVIATGGTALASYEIASQMGGEVVGMAFLIELGFLKGRSRLDGNLRIHSVLHF
ncbi:MAG TPA: adenine phosphoribosyltransferase [Rhodothermales bacterium]|nr:adenine phosphoribosyltransferase [Rhodothermales bacterium]